MLKKADQMFQAIIYKHIPHTIAKLFRLGVEELGNNKN